jgi:hypothetical protein
VIKPFSDVKDGVYRSGIRAEPHEFREYVDRVRAGEFMVDVIDDINSRDTKGSPQTPDAQRSEA